VFFNFNSTFFLLCLRQTRLDDWPEAGVMFSTSLFVCHHSHQSREHNIVKISHMILMQIGTVGASSGNCQLYGVIDQDHVRLKRDLETW